MNAPAELASAHRFTPREAGLWACAGAAVVFAHVGVSMAFQSMSAPLPETEATEEAMVVELAPLPFMSSAAVMSDVVSEEEPVEPLATEEVETEPVEEEAVADAEPEERPDPVQPDEAPAVHEAEPERVETETTEPVEQEMAEPVAEEVVEQDVAEAVEPEIVIPMPRPERVAEEAPRAEPPKKVARKVETKVERRKAETVRPARKAEVRREARSNAQASVESRQARAPTVNPARWNSAVRAAIARRAGRARGMTGTVRIQFVVSSSGTISSARVAGSSGNGRLDSAALGMVRSARVPAPPPGLPGSSHSFMIPLSFR